MCLQNPAQYGMKFKHTYGIHASQKVLILLLNCWFYLNSLTLWRLRGVTIHQHLSLKKKIQYKCNTMHNAWSWSKKQWYQTCSSTLSVNMLILKSILTLHAMIYNKTRQNDVHVWSRQPIKSYEKSK